MIGQIRKIRTPFYDMKAKSNRFKIRPGLVIAAADSQDYVVLPISSVSDSRRIHPEYDIKIEPESYPNLNLTRVSYIRTHKQTTIYAADLLDPICNMKESYPDLYKLTIEKRDKFSVEITRQALE